MGRTDQDLHRCDKTMTLDHSLDSYVVTSMQDAEKIKETPLSPLQRGIQNSPSMKGQGVVSIWLRLKAALGERRVRFDR